MLAASMVSSSESFDHLLIIIGAILTGTGMLTAAVWRLGSRFSRLEVRQAEQGIQIKDVVSDVREVKGDVKKVRIEQRRVQQALNIPPQ